MTFKTLDGCDFLEFGVSNAKYLAFDILDENAFIVLFFYNNFSFFAKLLTPNFCFLPQFKTDTSHIICSSTLNLVQQKRKEKEMVKSK